MVNLCIPVIFVILLIEDLKKACLRAAQDNRFSKLHETSFRTRELL